MKNVAIKWLVIGIGLAVVACSDSVADGDSDVGVPEDDTDVVANDTGDNNASQEGDRWALQSSGVAAQQWHGLHFIDDQTGWILGRDDDGDGLLIHTDDGGDQWNEQSLSATESLFDVFFHDEDRGWLVEDEGVWRSDNGGQDWAFYEFGDEFDERVRTLFMLDESTGWAAGDGILRTDDGGESWTLQAGEDQVGPLIQQVYFSDESIGTAVGNGATIIHTRDGGESWDDVSPAELSGHITSMDFVDADRGWAASNGGLIVGTDDGGQSWQELTELSETISGLSFIDADHGWVATRGGEIYVSDDGGTQWQLEQIIRQPDLHDPEGDSAELSNLQMVHDQAGWAVGFPPSNVDVSAPIVRFR